MALKEFYKVDAQTGVILDIGLFDAEKETIPSDYYEGWGQSRGLHTPIYDFNLNDWVEGKSSDELLKEKKENKIQELKRINEQEIIGGFLSATTGHFYEFDLKDQANFTQQMLLLVSDPLLTDIQWKTLDADVVLHSREEFLQVVTDAQLHKQGNISKYWQLKGLVESATTVEEIEAITW